MIGYGYTASRSRAGVSDDRSAGLVVPPTDQAPISGVCRYGRMRAGRYRSDVYGLTLRVRPGKLEQLPRAVALGWVVVWCVVVF